MSHVEQRDVEKQYEWSKKGKKYKTKYFDALGQLFGEIKNGTESQSQRDTQGRNGTNHASSVAGKKRHSI